LTELPNRGPTPYFLAGGGELAGLLASRDWSDSLGAPVSWPQSLQTVVAMLLRSPVPIVLLWGEDGIMIYNDAYSVFAGRRHPQLLGSKVREGWPEVADFNDNVMRVGLAGGTLAYKDQELILHRHGRPEQVLMNLYYSPVIGESGQPAGVIAYVIETTERVLVERRLAEERDTLEQRVAERTADLQNIRTFYTHSSECHAMLALRDDGSFEYEELNPATLALYGMTREQVIGRTVDDIFPPPLAAILNGHLAEALRKNAPHRYMRQQAGAAVEAVATPVPGEGRRRLTVTARDITERQNLEEQLRQAQKMEAVGHLTGGIAHDFNNLLQGIGGALDRVQNRIAEGRVNDVDRFLKAAIESTNRAASLTHRLLAFSRRQTLDPRPADVNKLIAGMHELVSRTMGPNVTVDVIGAIGLWPIRVDAPQLESSLLNLCINARDAMPEGGRLIIETANKWLDERTARELEIPPGQYVSLCVTDSGTGMPPDVIARAFDPFFTTKPLGKGTGLGLSMIYGFVRQSGGQVRIYSEVSKGTTMCLYFPRHLGSPDQEAVTEHEHAERGFGETVLVVDDEPTVRMLIAEVLSERFYHVLEAGDGPAALKILESDVRIDLLITDVGLPGGMNGRQVADAARLRRKDLKILFITGYAENAAVGNGHLDPGMEVLTKPFAMTTLGNKVREIIES
jgi:PAS domain S-box-containing protein